MAIITPLSTVHTGLSSPTAADILTVMADQFTGSTKHSIDLLATGGASNGFAVRSNLDDAFQMVFRRTGAQTIAMSIDAGGTVTDIGNTTTPPSGGSDISPEKVWTVDAATVKVLMSELNDAFAVFAVNGSDVHLAGGCSGRMYDIEDPGDAARGRDGLGLHCGVPLNATSNTHIWAGNGSSSARFGLIHAATGVWPIAEGSAWHPYQAARDNTDINGFVRPAKMTIRVGLASFNLNFGSYENYRNKYWRVVGTARADLSVIMTNNETNQGWIHLRNSSSNTGVWPWDRTVVP